MVIHNIQDKNTPTKPSLLFLCGTAVLASLCYILITYSPGFITGQGLFWQCRTDDCCAHLTGLLYFIHDQWRFPFFDVQGVNYPTGSNIIFTDSLPLMAIIAKFLYQLCGIDWNYFGWWAIFNTIFLAVSIVILLDSLNVRSIAAVISSVMFGLCALFFLYRSFYHIALSSQYVIVLATALYFYSFRQKNTGRLICLFVILLITTLLIHLYLFLMVYAIYFAFMFSLGFRRILRPGQCLFWFISSFSIIFILAFCMGYFRLDKTLVFYHGGYKIGPLNLLDMFIPSAYSTFFNEQLVRTTGVHQHNHGNYLGAGVLLLWVYILIRRPQQVFAGIRRHLWLSLTLAGLFVFSLSSRIYCGKQLLFHYDWIPVIQKVFETLRATDRFSWPLFFLLLITPSVILFKYEKNSKWALLLICFAIILQNIDVWKLRMYARQETSRSQATDNFSFYNSIIPRFDIIIISEEMETLWGPYTGQVRNIYYLAAKYNRPTNYCLTARTQTEWLTFDQIIEKTISSNKSVLYVMPYSTYQNSCLHDRVPIKNINGLVFIPYKP